MQEDDAFTERQKELLDALEKCDTVKKAAERLNISYGAAKQRLYRIRRKFWLYTGYLKELDRVGFNEIISKIPACQTCKFLKDDGLCRYSDDEIDVEGFDTPCAFWQQGELKAEK